MEGSGVEGGNEREYRDCGAGGEGWPYMSVEEAS